MCFVCQYADTHCARCPYCMSLMLSPHQKHMLLALSYFEFFAEIRCVLLERLSRDCLCLCVSQWKSSGCVYPINPDLGNRYSFVNAAEGPPLTVNFISRHAGKTLWKVSWSCCRKQTVAECSKAESSNGCPDKIIASKHVTLILHPLGIWQPLTSRQERDTSWLTRDETNSLIYGKM